MGNKSMYDKYPRTLDSLPGWIQKRLEKSKWIGARSASEVEDLIAIIHHRNNTLKTRNPIPSERQFNRILYQRQRHKDYPEYSTPQGREKRRMERERKKGIKTTFYGIVFDNTGKHHLTKACSTYYSCLDARERLIKRLEKQNLF